ncbi:hypothetical protein [Bizionia psychrotolerans]|uniref:hypothetical protein n=1 Tax=Bizionia psychrotolerans TaxID=1492901 RepID=UPI0006523D58|nr:hypothetical protein [Bizionia psychrotolerans]
MIEILQLPARELKKHIHQLANDYKQRTGITACLSCSGDVQRMLQYLKQIYMTTQFELKKPNVIYKIRWGGTQTISNANMTDELALEFLNEKPSRIELFSKYPENYTELLKADEPEGEPEPTDEKSEDIIEEIVKESSKKPCAGCKDKKISTKKRATRKTTSKKRFRHF